MSQRAAGPEHSPDRSLEQRYGARTPAQRRLIVVGVAMLAAAGIGWLVWAMLFYGRPLARSDQISFRVVDQNTAVTTMTVVRRNRDVEATCLLRAQAADHTIVGELDFTVGPSQPATTTVRKTVRTEREATSVSVVGCVADGQEQRR